MAATLLLPIDEVYKLFAFCGALYYGGMAVDLVGCPALVGEIIVGMLLGPEVADMFSDEMVAAIKVAGQAGLCLMVLEGGISMDADVLREKGVRAVVLAATGTVLPVLLGWAVLLALGDSFYSALAGGIALSSTAIGFTMRMMTDMNLLQTAEGQLITAAAMIDDVFSLILLSMISVVQDAVQEDDGWSSNVTTGNTAAEGGRKSAGGWAWTICRPILASAVVSVLGYLCFKIVSSQAASISKAVEGRLPARLVEDKERWKHRQEETMLLVLVGGGTLAAWLANGLHSTLLLGVFVVGASFCTVQLARDSWVHIAPLSAWTSRFFFGATVGFQVPVSDLFGPVQDNFGPGLLLTLAAILGKWLSGAWGVDIFHGGTFAGKVYWGTFMRVGCAMIGRGELGFQLATTAKADGILTEKAYSATIWSLLLATLLGPYAFRLSMKLTPCGLEKRDADGMAPAPAAASLEGARIHKAPDI